MFLKIFYNKNLHQKFKALSWINVNPGQECSYCIIIEITFIPKFKVYNCENLSKQYNLLHNCLVVMIESCLDPYRPLENHEVTGQ